MNRLSKQEVKKFKDIKIISLSNVADSRYFVEQLQLKNIEVFGFTDANNIGCIGYCYYIIYKMSNRIFASYMPESSFSKIDSLGGSYVS